MQYWTHIKDIVIIYIYVFVCDYVYMIIKLQNTHLSQLWTWYQQKTGFSI